MVQRRIYRYIWYVKDIILTNNHISKMSHEISNITDTLYHSLQYLVRRKHLLELFLVIIPHPADQVNCILSIPYLLPNINLIWITFLWISSIFIYVIINTGATIIIYNTNWNNDLEASSSIDYLIDKSSSLIDIEIGQGKIYFWLIQTWQHYTK